MVGAPTRAALIALLVWLSPVSGMAQEPDRSGDPEPTATDPATDPEPTSELVRGGGQRLEWTWPAFSTAEGAVTIGAVGSMITALIIGPNQDDPRRGGIWIDDDVRSALRMPTDDGRRRVRDVSDVLLTFVSSYPYLGDAMINAAWYHDSPDVAVQLALIDVEVQALTLATQVVVNVATSRERPFAEECGGELDAQTNDCVANNRYKSFFSGHSSMTFASASVTCMHHAYLPLHGGGFVEWVPCISGYLLAGTTGALRISSDVHYFTDVAVGALAGTTIGLTIPWLFHYRHGPSQVASGRSDFFSIAVVPTVTGIQAVGAF